jgi:helicase
LEQLSVEELSKIVPKRLAGRIKKRFSAEICNPKPATCNFSLKASISCPHTLNTNDQQLTTILEIDPHRPDRIIFMEKEVKVTPLAFSLISLLAQNRGMVLTYDYLLGTIWKENEDATYVQVTFHLSKIRRFILKAIGNNKKNIEKVKDIFKIISRRGIMLNLEEDKLKII